MLRSIIRPLALSLLAAPLALATADAQGRGNGPRGVPPGHMPRAGECRVWYDGVPPGRQPAPTSCREAERIAYRSRNARVIYGDRRYDDRRYDDRRDGRWEDRRDDRQEDRDRDGRIIRGDRDRDRDDRRDRNDTWPWDPSVYERNRTRLPYMPRTSELRTDRISSAIQRRVDGSVYRARYDDRNRDGRPERVVFYDRRGQALETWYDLRGDGRVDRVVRH